MTAPQGTQPDRSSAMKRYGPLIGIGAVIALIVGVVLLTGKKTDDAGTTAATNPLGGSSDVPITYEQAKKQGKEATITWVDNCDKATGRITMPSVYAPPCLPKFTGQPTDQGTGVTKDKVTIAVYVPSPNSDITAMFSANLDPEEKVVETSNNYVRMLTDLFETYGRTVEFVRFNGTGAPSDAVAAQADAVNVAETIKPFASIGAPMLTKVYAEELAKRKILCLGCGLALPDSFLQANAPYIWGSLPTPEQFLVNLGDYITNRVQGRKASFAGDQFKDRTRKFGVVHFEQNPPVFGEVGEQVRKCGADRGWQAGATETYEFEIGKMPERAPTIIAKMKEAEVTSIIFLGDPIMPIYLTQAAKAQNYEPEWIISGTPLVDTNVLGRFYEQSQWKHAFGLSNLAVRTPREKSEPWRLHEWYFGGPPVAVNTNAIIYPGLFQLFLGIHMAGPNLTPETFKAGLFNYPASGGGATNPHVSYGDHGFFKLLKPEECTSNTPRPDYIATDDMTEVWWDANATGPDEQGKSDKPGLWRFSNKGQRFLPGKMPNTEPDAFKEQNSVTLLPEPPPEDRPPDYPPPQGAPAASRKP